MRSIAPLRAQGTSEGSSENSSGSCWLAQLAQRNSTSTHLKMRACSMCPVASNGARVWCKESSQWGRMGLAMCTTTRRCSLVYKVTRF